MEQDKLKKLFETIALVNSESGLTEVLDRVLTASAEIVGAEASAILLVDSAGKNLRFASATGRAAVAVKRYTVPLGKGIAGWVAQNGETVVVPDTSKDPRFYKKIADELDEQRAGVHLAVRGLAVDRQMDRMLVHDAPVRLKPDPTYVTRTARPPAAARGARGRTGRR